jgi:hypothetical protein
VEAYQTQFSEHYTLYVEDARDGNWIIHIQGPHHWIEKARHITELAGAMKHAYRVGAMHFKERKITEPAIPFENLHWHVVSGDGSRQI